MESFADAEEWIAQCLVFDKSKMKQIGLDTLEMEFCCDLNLDDDFCERMWHDAMQVKVDRLEIILNEMIDALIDKGVDRWEKYHRKGITATKGYRQFIVKLSLHI